MQQELKNFQHFTDSCNNFSSNLYQEIASEQSEKNVVISTLSAHIILSLLYFGADEQTKKELKSGLYITDADKLQNELKYFLTFLNNIQNMELEISNAIYIDNNFSIFDEFLTMSTDIFQTNIEKVEFKNHIKSVEEINTFVKTKTKGRVPSIINPGDIDEYTKVILINALYFKGNWLYPFESQFTENKVFFNINNDEIYVPTMFKTLNLPHGYIQNLDANFIKMQYLNESFEMILLLPNEKYGLQDLESKFNLDLILTASYSTKEVDVSLPKFEIETTIDLKAALKKLGVHLMFEERANFNFVTEKSLYVDQILQKIFINVDEKGSEAAVTTAAQMRSRRMIMESENFIVDHPFLFIINHIPSSIPLFIGSIKQLRELPMKDEL